MFTGPQITKTLVELGVTHVVWLPDSTLGPWETAFAQEPSLSFVRVCREGEAWTVAAGLHLGGKRPLVIIQNTGLFESGDALRNVLFDLGLPLYAIIGYRSYLLAGSTDTAKRVHRTRFAGLGPRLHPARHARHCRRETARALPQMFRHGQTRRRAVS